MDRTLKKTMPTVSLVILVWLVSGSVSRAESLARHGEYRLDADYTLYRNEKMVRTFDARVSLGEFTRRAVFSPDGRLVAITFAYTGGGEGLYIYDVTEDRLQEFEGLNRQIAVFDWFEYAGDHFVIFSTEFSSHEFPTLCVVDALTGFVVYSHEGMIYNQIRDGGFYYYRYQSPVEPLRVSMVNFDDFFIGIMTDSQWPPWQAGKTGQDEDYLVISPRRARTMIEVRDRKVVTVLAGADLLLFAEVIHPEHGVLISTDGFVDEQQDHVFTREQVFLAKDNPGKDYMLGKSSGMGETTGGTLADYIRRIGGFDFAAADAIGYNRVIKSTHTTHSVFTYFREAIVVEYYDGGSEKTESSDWSSIRLVYGSGEDGWYLVGIVEDFWSP